MRKRTNGLDDVAGGGDRVRSSPAMRPTKMNGGAFWRERESRERIERGEKRENGWLKRERDEIEQREN